MLIIPKFSSDSSVRQSTLSPRSIALFCSFLFFHILPVKLISVCVMGCLHVQGCRTVHFPQVSAWVPVPLKGNSEQTMRPVCLLGCFYCVHTNSFLQHEGQMPFYDIGYKVRFSDPPVPCRTSLCPVYTS